MFKNHGVSDCYGFRVDNPHCSDEDYAPHNIRCFVVAAAGGLHRRAQYYLAAVLIILCGMMSSIADAQTNFDRYPQIYTTTPTGVNLQTGLYVYNKEEFKIGSLPFIRSYNGIPTTMRPTVMGGIVNTGSFGDWVHNFAWSVDQYDGYPTALFGNVYVESKLYRFSFVTGNIWSAWDQDSNGANLSGNVGSYVFTDKSGNVFTFGASGIQKVVYADGYEIAFTYDANKNVRTVMNSRGDAIVLDYVSGMLTTACGYNRALHLVTASSTCSSFTPEAKVSYAYIAISGKNYLRSATYPDGRVVTMSYVSQPGYNIPMLSCQTQPSTSICEAQNEYVVATTRCCVISKQTLPTGEVLTYNIGDQMIDGEGAQTWPVPPRISFGEVTNPDGSRTSMYYNYGIPEALYDVTGTTNYSWEGTSLTEAVYPGRNSVVIARDNRGNALSMTRRPPVGSSDAVTTITQSFDGVVQFGSALPCATLNAKLCNKPIYQRDARGNQTDFTYDSTHGGVLTETGPADNNGIRPVKRSSYVARPAWVSNGASGYSPAGPPIWLLAEERSCRAGPTNVGSNSCVLGTADEVVTTYDYGPNAGPNTLLLRGVAISADGAVQRTCYGYDARGRRISETKPNAGLVSCP